MSVTAEEMKRRTKQFALRVIKLVANLPKTEEARVVGCQLLRSATSVGANYRAACRARSNKDFVFKMGIVEEEADETVYWMELIVDAKMMTKTRVTELLSEGEELTAIAVSSIKTAKRGGRRRE